MGGRVAYPRWETPHTHPLLGMPEVSAQTDSPDTARGFCLRGAMGSPETQGVLSPFVEMS